MLSALRVEIAHFTFLGYETGVIPCFDTTLFTLLCDHFFKLLLTNIFHHYFHKKS